MSERFEVFHRNWWKRDPLHKGVKIPGPGRKTHICYANSEAEARAVCKRWNSSHEPGVLSRKAEFERV